MTDNTEIIIKYALLISVVAIAPSALAKLVAVLWLIQEMDEELKVRQ